ncbi:diguanylate cyclase domain-containing protein [Alteromonas sp. RKMC-009]|uniref:diguanylate cyclase domain-containing protein n=1 Tax=Alteromonas sp. RKMC-009 TaxID=2267264 RepID=UPI000E6A4F06|nr:diguanylate cyclase [Alteromonas sp. RKMC-009]AYA64153.1 diguanylate cyclase [Alteromonas sp. RKMC-009]
MPISRSRVLIVDDDITTIRLIAEALATDYEVIIATDAEDGLEQAISTEPELILLDVLMPEINGFSLCRKLKSDERTRRIPVVFVTGLTEVSDQAKGFEIGAVDYITKPIEVPLLRARVRTHVRLYRQTMQLESLAATDPLTGLSNRRKFDESLAHEIERCQRSQSELALLMIDIDDFKAYNDKYGHGKGDDCLITVAKLLKDNARRGTDLCCRLGGEEFGIILGETDRAGAMTLAEHIISVFNELKLPHETASAFPFLTVSIGVSVMDMRSALKNRVYGRDLVDKADEALYRAKSLGRNRAEFMPLAFPMVKKIG